MPRPSEDVTVEAELPASAHYLRDWLPHYIEAYELIGEDPPEVVENTIAELDDLIPFLQSDLLLSVDVSRGGPKATPEKCAAALRDLGQLPNGCEKVVGSIVKVRDIKDNSYPGEHVRVTQAQHVRSPSMKASAARIKNLTKRIKQSRGR